MSANADVLPRSGLIGSPAQGKTLRQVEVVREANDWNPEDFARCGRPRERPPNAASENITSGRRSQRRLSEYISK